MEFLAQQRNMASQKGLKKLELRTASIQLRTGTKVKLPSLYSKSAPESHCESRHLTHLYWGVVGDAGPMYSSITSLLSVICPSFSVSQSIMNQLGVKSDCSRVRDVSLDFAAQCLSKRSSIQLDQSESLAGKRVVIAIDGGRTRTRSYTDECTAAGNRKFDTNWREPKMFVITSIDEAGKREKDCLPIYDSTFGDDEMMDLLSQYLDNLDIDQAAAIQVVADGAPWIWNRVTAMLTALGVENDRIIETLDFYHASEHLHELKEYLPKESNKGVFEKMKNHLWSGNIASLGRLLVKSIPDLDLDDFGPFAYFRKNKERIDYQWLRMHAWPCGSGVVESGIRRIINLRFKSPSSFWYPENVEKLILLRAIVLSGRWNIMLNNLFTKHHA